MSNGFRHSKRENAKAIFFKYLSHRYMNFKSDKFIKLARAS